jgi:hypothetical protein
MRRIPLTNSEKAATIDDGDFPLVSMFSWELTRDGYAVTLINGEVVEMGHLILNPEIARGGARALCGHLAGRQKFGRTASSWQGCPEG